MRCAAVLALLLCAGQGEPRLGRGAPAPRLPRVPALLRASPRRARFQHRGQRRRLLPAASAWPAAWPPPQARWTPGLDSQPHGTAPGRRSRSGLRPRARPGPAGCAPGRPRSLGGGGGTALLSSPLPLRRLADSCLSQSPPQLFPSVWVPPCPCIRPTRVPRLCCWCCHSTCLHAPSPEQLPQSSFPGGESGPLRAASGATSWAARPLIWVGTVLTGSAG